MAKIQELSDILADQIAAGEVVERPASVVKELVENAIDAGSSRIDILLAESGLKMIRVIDNGSGIEGSQVKTAFKRHATSKITSRADLFRVGTLGFRGEALPSIASIADVKMTSSTAEGPGQFVHYRGGELIEHREAQSRQGTDITVSDLFFNTPARLKYLKSLATELSKITDIINRIALSYPEIAFSLQNDERQLMRTSGQGNVQQVLANIYGTHNAQKMLDIHGESVDFRIDGYVSLPEFTRANRSYITILVNGRYIKNFHISKAIIEGYGSKLMVGRYPVAVINIQTDPLLVDVNVHPSKLEVRISEENALTELISKTIFDRLADQNLIPDAVDNLKKKRISKPAGEQLDLTETVLSGSFGKPTPTESAAVEEDSAAALHPSVAATKPIIISTRQDLQSDRISEFREKYADSTTFVTKNENTEGEEKTSSTSRFPALTYIGQMHGTYLFAEADDGLYIIDQHAAQERINYEYYRVQIGQVSDDQQDLLVPIYLDYSTTDTLRIKEKQSVLEACGLYLEEFGRNTFIVRHHPTWFKKGQEEDTVKEMVDYVLNDRNMTVAKFREATAIMMSCKRAIKANHHLDDLQAKQLLKDLAKVENPFNCPHGRPVLVHFSTTDMEKMFKRIQDPHNTNLIDEDL
ncbi:DNA mismatch repair endonuclease MutL [Pediococcus acidilactici]|jgi:DNA mismatch repair protein MutL|uniref:DNA mismatch repair endonuclease MutL n=1 Tax=Pediococcus acidilactici TaxID=1254 RepID=UPI000FE2A74B|nr:DNA mismatch repair endonuclease MutL [Pediococcus acidilactici]KAF0371142.1 DNA mismatch repair endonuclease MutL [Pediococcus acidilactici]KAF0382392.1 DNA mismatch repair endonuclease MutL [Pediococcus acidilactici]KAF0455910.1 DNA mismatch repair endonuclease MutL [Pediococcus acidilactici]KAF0475713.1 DNA mismatch repair endonuclease MutL [Pediococcus acidilactici]KAF0535822.1 DNA mismatch repair endonuclease MutL [Pediococcus acidilactici]